jgi:predicted amidohydrolase YtcJ
LKDLRPLRMRRRAVVAAGIAVASLLLSAAAAVAATPVASSCAGARDLALRNGKILTMATPAVVSELVIRDGKVVHVGPGGRPHYTPCTREIDLKGRTAVPGLIDGHIHLVTWGFRPGNDLRLDLASSISDVEEALRGRAAGLHAGEWITAVGGWSHVQLRENRLPTLAELDRAAPNNPVFFWERNGAAAVTNSLGKASFEAEGIAVAADGSIPAEGARADVAYSRLAKAATDPMRGTREALAYLARVGLTTVSDDGVNAGPAGSRPPERSWHSGHVDVYTAYDPILSLARKDELPVRIRINFLDTPDAPSHDAQRLKYQFPMFGNDQIATLCMGEYITPDRANYEAAARAVAQRGWCHEQHVMGSKEIRDVIGAWEKVAATTPINTLHWRLAHVMNIEQVDLDRLRVLGAGVNISPMLYDNGDRPTTPRAIAYRTIVKSGVPVGGISDGPNYLPVDPFVHIAIMVTGKDNLGRRVVPPDQTLTRQEALALYTVNNAWFMGDDRMGVLRPGSLGDVVVLDQDYLTTPEDRIRTLKPTMTIVGGRVVYQQNKTGM